MEFKKPPILEAWIEFYLDLTDESITWDRDFAESFIDREYGAEFPKRNFNLLASGGKVQVEKGIPHIINANIEFDRIRAKTENEDYCIQAGRDILVVNQIKKDDIDWPRYETLLDKAIDALGRFITFRGLNGITGTSLHYRDLIVIPPKENEDGISLDKYFRISPRIPTEDFGSMSSFNVSFELPDICEDCVANLTLQTTRSRIKSEDNCFRFMMDWHLRSTCLFEKLDQTVSWLNNAHQSLHTRFKNSFTEEGLKLFEPEGE